MAEPQLLAGNRLYHYGSQVMPGDSGFIFIVRETSPSPKLLPRAGTKKKQHPPFAQSQPRRLMVCDPVQIPPQKRIMGCNVFQDSAVLKNFSRPNS
jgi:hypothetical protein